MTRNFLYITGVLVMFILYSIASNQSYEDEVISFNHTCAMIAGGYWPEQVANWEIEKCHEK